MKRALKEPEAAEYCGFGGSTFRKWRTDAARGGPAFGPSWVTIGSRILYMREALDAWLDKTAIALGTCASKRTSTSGAEAQRRHEARPPKEEMS